MKIKRKQHWIEGDFIEYENGTVEFINRFNRSEKFNSVTEFFKHRDDNRKSTTQTINEALKAIEKQFSK